MTIEINLRHIILVPALCICTVAGAQNIEWSRVLMDGSRAGTLSPSADNVGEALGHVKGNTYYAPSGKTFRKGSAAKVARLVIEAQDAMKPVKKVVGYSTEHLAKYAPESPLSNYTVDFIMARVARETGRKVHCGITNFGGIRVEMPKGEVLVDDIRSMFPFKNTITYVALKGSRLREILEGMIAAGKMEVLGGIELVASRQERRILSLKVDGKDLDDNAIYGLATISFLLHGGDNLYLGEGVEEVIDIPVDIYDAAIQHIEELTAKGLPVEGRCDGRVRIL